jgi:hypothetical protein
MNGDQMTIERLDIGFPIGMKGVVERQGFCLWQDVVIYWTKHKMTTYLTLQPARMPVSFSHTGDDHER